MMTDQQISGWYAIFPEGCAWVVVRIDQSGRVVDRIEQANAETHRQARDWRAPVVEAIEDEQTDAQVTAQDAERVLRAYDPDLMPECCVVERIVGMDD